MSGEAEDEVAGLPDVDIVPGDVVEEQQTLARGQTMYVSTDQNQMLTNQNSPVHVDPAEVDHVVVASTLLHQHSQQEHHLVQGGSTS